MNRAAIAKIRQAGADPGPVESPEFGIVHRTRSTNRGVRRVHDKIGAAANNVFGHKRSFAVSSSKIPVRPQKFPVWLSQGIRH